VDPQASNWFGRRTSASEDWPLAEVLALKRRHGVRISAVIPARNEERTIADVVACIRTDLMETEPLVDELVVVDSLSSDGTGDRARAAGATVCSVRQILPDFGVQPGKGEALWKSMFVTTGDLLVFIDADLTEWGSHFVTGLLGPLLGDPGVALVKGFYDRISQVGETQTTDGGRVTELVARPLIALRWPQLSAVVQPLAGEWAVRRDLFAAVRVPTGYGVEFATLLDTLSLRGLDAIAQVDLGRRAHRHQSVHDLGVMATEILAVADRRSGLATAEPSDEARLDQFDRRAGSWRARRVPMGERPPAATVLGGAG
jgi:glucosyl-3-phosphoglycerate synthase